jgi:hypothetical protein
VLALVERGERVSFGEAWRPSKSMVLEPMLYDVSELMKDATVMKVRSTRLSYFKVIKDLSLSFPSLTPIS